MWNDGRAPDGLDDPNYKDADFCNEFGFVGKSEYGSYGFYTQCFRPQMEDLESDELENIFHTQTAYAELNEATKCFVRDLRLTEKKSGLERVASSGSMRMSYEVLRLPNGTVRLCEAYTFDSLGAFLYVDFSETWENPIAIVNAR